MAAFEYRQAEEIRDALATHGVHYLFIGKSGAVLLGFPDTTQDADIYIERSPENGRALVAALRDLKFTLTPNCQQRSDPSAERPGIAPAPAGIQRVLETQP